MNFTPSQQNAITARDCSLIISAGAGSGKTAVLTERILERICDPCDDCNINDFLIVTFTNKAAKELSDRIRKKLSERAAKQPHNKKILKNLALLPLAKISTINSFCYEIVRENFQKTGLSAAVRIADEAEMGVIRTKLMNEVVDEYFEENGDDGAFIAAYEIFASAKKDEGFVNMLLELDVKLSNVTDRDAFCRQVLNSYREISVDGGFFDTRFGKILCELTRKKAQETMDVLEALFGECAKDEVLVEKYLPVIRDEFDFAREVYHACDKGYEAVYDCIKNHVPSTFAKARLPKDFANIDLKDMIKDVKNSVCSSFLDSMTQLYGCSKELLLLSAKDTELVLSKMFELLSVFSQKLDEKKRELGVIEFSDAERYTLGLLVESVEPFKVTPLAEQLRKRFKEIYIDEYQDVNPLQDMIFRAISRHNGQGEYSRFMVGDIKQSIYRFRGASSDIFMSYREAFSDIEEKTSTARIFMSDNFRCCESVIKLTNFIFEKLMGGYYTEGDALKFARNEQNKVTNKALLCAFSYEKEVNEGIPSADLEAALVCKKIKEIVNNPKYTDSDGRMFCYSDIGILARNKAGLKNFEAMLTACGIPVSSDVGESFYGKKEIMLCLNILSSIDNPERDINLAGFMRSYAGAFSDDELAAIKQKYRKMSLYRAVVNYAENEDEACDELSEKCRVFLEKLRGYREFSRGKSADKLLWKLYCDMDLLGYCSSDSFTSDGKSARKNLLKLYAMARDFSATSFRGIGAFVDYINGSMEKQDIKSEREMTGGCVRLMTVHASKGLEFPVCFVSNLSARFRKFDVSSKLVFSEKYGIATKLCDTEEMKCTDSDTALVSIETPYRLLMANEIEKELMDEEIRVLYVALTRARDLLIMTGALPKKTENAMKDAQIMHRTGGFSESGSFMAMLLGVLSQQSCTQPFYDAAGICKTLQETQAEEFLECEYISCEDAVSCYKDTVLGKSKAEKDEENDEIDSELLEKLMEKRGFFVYASENPAKITVSQLKKGLLDEEKIAEASKTDTTANEECDPVPMFVSGRLEENAAEKGTAMHMFMQFCEFEACENGGCEKQAEILFEKGFIDERQKNLLDYDRLNRFFGSEFYGRIKNSKEIYREQRFNLYADSFEDESGRTFDEEILVQGVIDLFFENDDGTYTVVDFKTDRVFGKDAESVLIERHKEQLMYYKRAVMEMTGCEVKNTYIYSFSLMREIEVE